MKTYNMARPGANYWGATDDFLSSNGGRKPLCPIHQTEMVEADDHGNFVCFQCQSDQMTSPPQVDTEGMSDVEKAKVPPLRRLHSVPTKAEQRLFSAKPGTKEYDDALVALDEERKG